MLYLIPKRVTEIGQKIRIELVEYVGFFFLPKRHGNGHSASYTLWIWLLCPENMFITPELGVGATLRNCCVTVQAPVLLWGCVFPLCVTPSADSQELQTKALSHFQLSPGFPGARLSVPGGCAESSLRATPHWGPHAALGQRTYPGARPYT